MLEIVHEWIEKADKDLLSTKILIKEVGLENQVGFHCQQAIEKWLKAYLISKNGESRKIHDLFALVLECEKYDPNFEQLEPIIEGITDFAVEFRYPGYWATPEEAKDALQNTEKSRAFVMTKL